MRITLCGSARFEAEFKTWMRLLTLSGHTVYGLAANPSDMGDKDWMNDEQKTTLDLVHLDKILNSSCVVVICPLGYIGFSTHREIEWAYMQGRSVYFTESPKMEIDMPLPFAHANTLLSVNLDWSELRDSATPAGL